MTISVGFDIGGTFTDLMLLDSESGEWQMTKVRSTSRDLAAGCIDGISALLRRAGVEPSAVRHAAHGSTVATNTFLERRGAKTALITTQGFRDVLEIRRQVMPNRYDATVPKPEPLVPHTRRFEVLERTLADGTVERELDVAAFETVLRTLEADGVEAVAISFLHSYANPANEDRAVAVAREGGQWFVTSSHTVLNELREYERTSSVVANAYLAPSMRSYLEQLAARLDGFGVTAPLLVLQSNGGLVPSTHAADMPVASLFSGPAAGVVAACAVAAQCGVDDFVSLDMGGTSCDLSLVNNRRPREAFEQEVDGWPIRTPRLDLHSVGAGGGSIASVDAGGLLRVGPRSAGSSPGPAAYGLGGVEPTVTDAHVVLGRIGAGQELADKLVMDGELARTAIARLGAKLGLTDVATAAGILDVVNATMIQAIRLVSIEEGHDPRSYALIAFGGAGPLHACELAKEMGLRQVIVPPTPGALCALGLLLADIRMDVSRSRFAALNPHTSTNLKESLTELATELRRSAAVASRPELDWQITYSVDARYVGQGFHLSLPLTEPEVASLTSEYLIAAFDDAHKAIYGYAWEESAREVVGIRASARAAVGSSKNTLPVVSARQPVGGARPVYFKEFGWIGACPVIARDTCVPGTSLQGPMIIEQMDSTVVVPPDFQGHVDDGWNLVLTHEPSQQAAVNTGS